MYHSQKSNLHVDGANELCMIYSVCTNHVHYMIGWTRNWCAQKPGNSIFTTRYFLSSLFYFIHLSWSWCSQKQCRVSLPQNCLYLCHKIVYPQSTFFTPHHPDQIGVDYYLLRARLAFICNKGESLGKEGGNGCLVKMKIWFLFMLFFISI